MLIGTDNQMGLCVTKHEEGDEASEAVRVGGKVGLVTTKETWEEKLSQASRESKIVLANFSAAWCGPCKMIAPYYCELSEKYPSLMFLTIDVDELSDLSTSYDIKATPAFFFLKDGQQIDKLVGSNKAELATKISTIIDSQS